MRSEYGGRANALLADFTGLTWLVLVCLGSVGCSSETQQTLADAQAGADAAAEGDGQAAQTPEAAGQDHDASVAADDGSALIDAQVDTGMLDAGGDGAALSMHDDLPYARSVESFVPGANAGFGQESLPDIVLGAPHGKGVLAGGLHVLSLGVGGEIVVGFGPYDIVDGPGPDFVVFENSFWPGGDDSAVFSELGEVSVSSDGAQWHTFVCDVQGTGMGRYPGCAGWTPTEAFEPLQLQPLDATESGGDGFDLAQLGLSRARYVRVRDLSSSGDAKTAGFDLDAVGLVHFDDLAP